MLTEVRSTRSHTSSASCSPKARRAHPSAGWPDVASVKLRRRRKPTPLRHRFSPPLPRPKRKPRLKQSPSGGRSSPRKIKPRAPLPKRRCAREPSSLPGTRPPPRLGGRHSNPVRTSTRPPRALLAADHVVVPGPARGEVRKQVRT